MEILQSTVVVLQRAYSIMLQREHPDPAAVQKKKTNKNERLPLVMRREGERAVTALAWARTASGL